MHELLAKKMMKKWIKCNRAKYLEVRNAALQSILTGNPIRINKNTLEIKVVDQPNETPPSKR